MEVFSNFQIIPSIRRLTDLDTALESGAQVILLTDADITNLQVLTQKIHAAGKQVWINTELLGGFGKDQAGLKLLKNYYKVDGVMSTRICLPSVRQAVLERQMKSPTWLNC